MNKIYTSKNLNNIEKTTISECINYAKENKIQPSERVIKSILNYSKSIYVLKSPKTNKSNICNIN